MRPLLIEVYSGILTYWWDTTHSRTAPDLATVGSTKHSGVMLRGIERASLSDYAGVAWFELLLGKEELIQIHKTKR